MKLLFTVFALSVLCLMNATTKSYAQSARAPSVTPAADQSQVAAPVLSIAPAANDAVQVVNAFMTAMSNGNLALAQKFLDPGVVVVNNGVIHGSRNDYLNGQAKSDAAYLQGAQRQLLRRQARAGANVAWVISEKVLRMNESGKVSARLTSETMLLVKAIDGWKIIHIHWSSRVLPSH